MNARARPKELYTWTQTVGERFPHLTRPQVAVLALYSFGMVLAKSCSLSALFPLLAPLLASSFNTVRQRLKEFYKDAPHKAGKLKGGKKARRALHVSSCFAPLLAWVVALWQGQQLALALDATLLGDRFVVLSFSVLYRGGAIPVAWAVLPANVKGAWRPHWEALLSLLAQQIPPTFTGIVLADRGLYAKWLYQGIVRNGWHPLLRVQAQSKFRPEGWVKFVPMPQFAPKVGSRWQGKGMAFSAWDNRLRCTLLARGEEGHEGAWLCVTDLEPQGARGSWYGLRMWIEAGYRTVKGGLWQWQKTRMKDCERVERLWLVIAVGTLWVAQVGGEGDLVGLFGPLPGEAGKGGKAQKRAHSIYKMGAVRLLALLLLSRGWPLRGRLIPEPWPDDPLPLLHFEAP